MLELGFSYLSSLSLPEIVQPHLEALSRDVDESVSAAVLDGTDIVYVARVPTRRIMSVRITIGTRFPAFATSMGRVLLAGLPDAAADAALAASDLAQLTDRTLTDRAALRAELARVRAQGWSLVDGELEPGLRSIAAPLHGRDGRVVAALNVSTSATRDSVDRLPDAYLRRASGPRRRSAPSCGCSDPRGLSDAVGAGPRHPVSSPAPESGMLRESGRFAADGLTFATSLTLGTR